MSHCLGYLRVCLCIHACFIDCRWKQSNDSVFLSWPSPSLLVNLSLTPVFPLCSLHLPRRAEALSVFLPCCLKCFCSAFCSCSVLTLCGVNGKSPKTASLNRIAVCGRRVGTTAHLPPFNLSLYCYWESESHILYHYLEILSLTAHALVFLVQCVSRDERSFFSVSLQSVFVCVTVFQYSIKCMYRKR